jgi:glycogen debranching enzyme
MLWRLAPRDLGTIGVLAFALLTAASAARPSRDDTLARDILADEHMRTVREMARQLLKEDLTAGAGYREVWIRDFNTFEEVALEVNEASRIRQALLTFVKFQGTNGDIPDGFIPQDHANGYYTYRSTPLAPGLVAHKNTAETDQESSLVQAVRKYVSVTGDRGLLDEVIGGETVRRRLDRALTFVMAERLDASHGLVWGATTADWGDLQPEHAGAVELDATSHRAIDVYDNAMFVIAINDYLELVGAGTPDAARWTTVRDDLVRNVRTYLRDTERHKFVAHLYLPDSPFPAGFDERDVYVHGGTTVAIEAGLLTRDEAAEALERMRANVRAAGAGSIGLTIFPPYPAGAFKSPGMGPYEYQNGGDWCWFGGRMVQQLVRLGFTADAYRELQPMVARVERAGDFQEWWTRDNEPRGSGQFRGSAGVLGRAIEMLQAWAKKEAGPSGPASLQ